MRAACKQERDSLQALAAATQPSTNKGQLGQTLVANMRVLIICVTVIVTADKRPSAKSAPSLAKTASTSHEMWIGLQAAFTISNDLNLP